MNQTWWRTHAIVLTSVAALWAASGPADAQAWFGLPLPGPVSDPSKSVVDSQPADFPVDPLRFGPGPRSPLLSAEAVKQDLRTIVQFSLDSRASGDFLWGRIAGTPAYMRTVEWAARELREAGLKDVSLDTFSGRLVLPTSGEVRLMATPDLGAGSRDVVLRSAMVGGRGPVDGEVTAPLVYMGRATGAEIAARDVRRKVAVIHTAMEPGLPYTGDGRHVKLIARGAVGVIEVLDLPGNIQAYDTDRHGCGQGLCFTIGGEDGYFLESALAAAAAEGKTVQVSLKATSKVDPAAQAANAIGYLPGKTARVIVINAHADSWFTGADDNGGGLAVLLALARYFARQPQLERTLVFHVSAGHHTLSGPTEFLRVHRANLAPRTDLVINLEHVAAGGLTRMMALSQTGMTPTPDAPRRNFGLPAVATTHAFPKQVGVSNRAPFVLDLWRQGATCFGLSLERTADGWVPGEMSSMRGWTGPTTQMISVGPLYHTSGESLDSVSDGELERAARFHAHLVRQVANASRSLLEGGAWERQSPCPRTP